MANMNDMERKVRPLMKKPVCVGVVGAGIISDIYLKNMTGKFSNLRVKSVSARHMEKAREKAARYGIEACSVEDMMADPEIEMIVNLTPVGSHEAVTRMALLAGKHVYTEKTITNSFETAQELCRIADQKGLFLGSAPDTFLGSSLQSARRAVDQGILGDITGFSATVNRCNDVLLCLFPIGRQPGAGICKDFGVYYITALVSLLGPVSKTAAFVRTPYPKHRNIIPDSPEYGQWFDSPNESEVSAILQLKSGVTGSIHLNGDSNLKEQANFVILGTKGMLYLTDPNLFGGTVRFRPNVMDFDAPDAYEDLRPGNTFSGNERGLGPSEMAEAIRNGSPRFRTSKELGLHVLEVLQGMLESGESQSFRTMTTDCPLPAPFYD